MNRRKGAVALLASVLILTGCGAQIPQMTEEQTEIVTQYAANLLLKYDKNYESGILSEDRMAEMMRRQIVPTPIPSIEEQEEYADDTQGQDHVEEDLIGGGNTDIVIDNRTLAEFFGLEGIDITYMGYSLTDSYPESDSDEFYFAMDATMGCKLLVIQFQVTNQSAEAYHVDILNQSPRFRLFINGGEQINALTTLLTDDLKTMNDTLEAGESKTEVIIVEITQEDAELLQSSEELQLDLTVKTQEDSLTISLLQ